MQVKFFNKPEQVTGEIVDVKTGRKLKEVPNESALLLINGKPQMNYVLEQKTITVYHAWSKKSKDSYYGSFSDGKVEFHFFLEPDSHSIVGRITQLDSEKFEISSNMKSLKGGVSSILLEAEESERFNFREKSREYKVVIKNGNIKIGTLQLKGVLVNNPLEYFKNTSSREMINCYVDADGVCDYSFDFGMGYTQGIKSRDDYYELFRRRYDITKIVFKEWLPSASTMFKCFENCFNLKEIDISAVQGSATVFTRCFANCKDLEILKMNKNKNSCRIGGMFSGCLSLKQIEFPFEELSAAKRWRYDTEQVYSIKAPLMNGFMEFL